MCSYGYITTGTVLNYVNCTELLNCSVYRTYNTDLKEIASTMNIITHYSNTCYYPVCIFCIFRIFNIANVAVACPEKINWLAICGFFFR